MKVVYFYSEGRLEMQDILWTLLEEGYDVEEYAAAVSADLKKGEEFETLVYTLKNYMEEKNPQFSISWDYIPAVSEACEMLGIPYVAWLYDSPMGSIYDQTIKNSCNFIFVFDRSYYEELKQKGITDHCFYLPLAINTTRTGALKITNDDTLKYRADISFVGSLYQNPVYDVLEKMVAKDDIKMLEYLFNQRIFDWHEPIMSKKLTPDADEYLRHYFAELLKVDKPYLEPDIMLNNFLLARKYTQMQRRTILKWLSERFQLTIYSGDDTSGFERAIVKGAVSYHDQMPKVFFSSKINLNITTPSIVSGIPLRCWDIMGVGGFLMSNYQSEFMDYFIPGKDMEVYYSVDELTDKCEYYLSHEKERTQIAANGYRKVKEEHNYKKRLAFIIDKVFG